MARYKHAAETASTNRFVGPNKSSTGTTNRHARQTRRPAWAAAHWPEGRSAAYSLSDRTTFSPSGVFDSHRLASESLRAACQSNRALVPGGRCDIGRTLRDAVIPLSRCEQFSTYTQDISMAWRPPLGAGSYQRLLAQPDSKSRAEPDDASAAGGAANCRWLKRLLAGSAA